MKKLILGLLTFSLVSIFSIATAEKMRYECTVSSVEENNVGVCKELSSGNGDMCFNFGSGPACNDTRDNNPPIIPVV